MGTASEVFDSVAGDEVKVLSLSRADYDCVRGRRAGIDNGRQLNAAFEPIGGASDGKRRHRGQFATKHAFAISLRAKNIELSHRF